MKKIIVVFCTIVLLISCKKTQGPQGPEGIPGTSNPFDNGTGMITGKAIQFDEYTHAVQYTANLNNVTVSIDGTTMTTLTDVAGNYTLSNVPAGVYDISYTKPNCCLKKKQQVVFPGTISITLLPDSIYDKPTYTFTNVNLKDTLYSGSHVLKLDLHFTSNTKDRNFIVAYSKTNAIDLGNPESYDQVYIAAFGPGELTTYPPQFLPSHMQYQYNPQLYYPKFPSGTLFYAKVYPISSLGYGYYDYVKNKNVFTTFGAPSPVFTLSVP